MYKKTVKNLIYLNMLSRYYHYKASVKTGLHYGQLPILEAVRNNEGCTQKKIAEELHISPPSVATSVKRMIKAGLLKKHSLENDMRCSELTLTDKGMEASETCRREFDKVDEKMFSGITEEECASFNMLLERLINNLDSDNMKTYTLHELKHMIHATETKETKDR